MRNNFALGLIVLMGSAACGTREYAAASKDQTRVVNKTIEQQVDTTNPKASGPVKALLRPAAPDGYLWDALRARGVRERDLSRYRCLLKDDPGVNYFDSLFSALLGGALTGLIVRASGAWFFGRPSNFGPKSSGPTPWVWTRIVATYKNTIQGVTRGAALGGLCHALLTGKEAPLWHGILGADFLASSTALTVAGIGGLGATLVARAHAPGDPPDDSIFNRPGAGAITKSFLYRLRPGLFVLGTSAVFGAATYLFLRTSANESDPECARFEAKRASVPNQHLRVTPSTNVGETPILSTGR